jgi:hypothetical protein
MLAMHDRAQTARGQRIGLWFVVAAFLVGGCGGGTETSAALVSGLPKCDPSLLHPRVTVGATAGLPGKLIVYVDGVMACVDDVSRVDQMLPQIEGHNAPPSRPTP